MTDDEIIGYAYEEAVKRLFEVYFADSALGQSAESLNRFKKGITLARACCHKAIDAVRETTRETSS